MQCVWELYPQIVLAIGLDSQDNVISLYAGSDEAAALAAIDAAGKAGTINLDSSMITRRRAGSCATRQHRLQPLEA
jgi:hypothetical protein